MQISRFQSFLGILFVSIMLSGCGEKRPIKKELDPSLRDYKRSQEKIEYLDQRSTPTLQK